MLWLKETEVAKEMRYGKASRLLGLIEKGLAEDNVCTLHVQIFPYASNAPSGFKAEGSVLGVKIPRLIPISIMYADGLLVVRINDQRKQFVLDNKEPGQIAAVAQYIQQQFEAAIL